MIKQQNATPHYHVLDNREIVPWIRLCDQHKFKEAHCREDERAGHCLPDTQEHSRGSLISGALYPGLGELLREVQVVSNESGLSTAKALSLIHI